MCNTKKKLALLLAITLIIFAPSQVFAASFTANDITGDTGASRNVAMGDVDGDGDLDIYVSNFSNEQNKLWINDGNGNFTANDITGDTGSSFGASMGDVDGDGDLDIHVANYLSAQNRLWINDGNGNFTANDITGDTSNAYGTVMGDVDGDGDLDIYVIDGSNQNDLWINDGNGNFTANNITGDNSNSYGTAMGDVDGDGDLDIYVANYTEQNNLWINDGSGNFTANDITGDTGASRKAAMGDVDGDGDLDIYVTNDSGSKQNKLWINDGSGNFTANDITGDVESSIGLAMGDVDGDGDLDIYVGNYNHQNNLWINDGSGNFTADDITGDGGDSMEAAMGDVDGDGDLDIYVANLDQQNKLWINETTDVTNPFIYLLSPADNATGIDTSSDLVITFSESVDAESGNIILKKTSDDSTVETFDVTSDISGSGTNEITITPSTALDTETEYYVQIDATAFDDSAGNSYAGISDTTTWSFTTVDETNPTVATLSPTDDATSVSISANLVITFNEAVDAETGNITLKKASDDSTVETFDVTSDISGSGTTEITIDPAANLAYETGYYVHIDASAFDDAAGNSFAGISDTTTWSFTTQSEPVAASSGSVSGGIIYGCKDKAASNYDYFTSHKQELCEYDTPSVTDITELIEEHNTLFVRAHEAGITLPDMILETLDLEPQTSNSPHPNTPNTVRDLERGMEGDDVVALQELLIAAGYSIPAGATGYFGLQTEYALDAYQLDNTIEPRGGYFGPITRAQMKGAELAGVWW